MPRQVQSTAVGGITGVEMQSGIAWIQHRQGQMSRALLRPHQKLDVSVRIHRDTEPLFTPIGHCLAKWSGASLKAVAGAGRDRSHWPWPQAPQQER